MEAVVVLLILLINLLVTCFLISVLYFCAIEPMRKRIESNRVVPSQVQHFQESQRQHTLPVLQKPANVLPSIDDIPEEALYGEDTDEDVKTKYPTDQEVQETMSFNDVYSRVNLDEDNAWKMLSKLKSNDEIETVRSGN